MSSKEISSLTGLRGAAATYVLVYHAHEYATIPAPLNTILHHGYIAVDIFFILGAIQLGC